MAWKHSYPCQGGGGGYPGPRVTPAIDGELLCTESVEGKLYCLETATGKPRWEQDLGKLRRTRGAKFWHGASCHPLIVGGVLVMETGSEKGDLAGFDKLTGAVLWQSGNFKLGYGSPVHATLGGVSTVVAFTGSAVAGLSPQDGKGSARNKVYNMAPQFLSSSRRFRGSIPSVVCDRGSNEEDGKKGKPDCKAYFVPGPKPL